MELDKVSKEAETSMKSAFSVFKEEIGGLAVGRVSASFLNPVTVKVYGSNMPISQLANIAVQDRTLFIQAWDVSNADLIARAISESGLGVTPLTEGGSIRINVPPVTQERRDSMIKAARQCAERCRVSIRNVRRHYIDLIKKTAKSEQISEDYVKKLNDDLQKKTDFAIKDVDDFLSAKEKEILQ